MKFSNLLQIFWLVLGLYSQPGILESLFDEKDIFYGPHKTSTFNHLAVDKNNRTLYIGAVDRLYRLSSDLKLLANVTTFSNYSSTKTKHNKILVINQRGNELIACGCVTADFVCEFYNFNIYPSKLYLLSETKISNLTKSGACLSTTTFIANNKQDALDGGFMKMYFAVSYNGYPAINLSAAIGTFNLNNMSKSGENVDTSHSEGFIMKYRDKYNVNYVYGFESGKYKYFLTTQNSSNTPGSPFVTKLIRICHSEELLWKRYTEIPIECKSPISNETYNMVQTATIGKPGLQLARSMHISPNDSILLGVFLKMRPTSNEPNNLSALCIYSINEIDDKFNENIRSCFNGKGSRGFESIILQNQTCIKQNQTKDSDFCASNVIMPLVGDMPISAFSVISFNALATAIATKPSENHNDVFIGTMTGHLKALVLKKAGDACAYTELTIEEQTPVNSDLLFSPQMDNLYVMTKLKLIKIKLQSLSCSSYTTYNSCVESKKEFCDWCGSKNTCTTVCDCPFQFEVVKKNFKHVQIGAFETLKLHIPSLHSISSNVNIHCIFNISNVSSSTYGQSTKSNHYNIHCPIPEVDIISLMPMNSDHLNAELLIYPSNVWDYASTNIVFFNCYSYTSCNTCVTSRFDCQWHSKEQRCMHFKANVTKDVLHTQHNCEWCQSTNTCESRDNCSSPLIRYFSCPGSPSPSIASFKPLSGPWEGGTNITIQGESLFYKFDDEYINQNITVAGVACTPYRDKYVPMESITCGIEKSNSSPGQAGPVVIHLNGESITSTENFEFVIIKITSISPKEGPEYGGTVLVTVGENLNAGRSIEILVGNSSCSVFSRNSTTIQCITNSYILLENAEVSLKFDDSIRNSTTDSFSYVEDPDRDEKGFNRVPKGIPSGNITILIRDSGIGSTQKLLLRIHNGDRIYNSSCKIRTTGSKKAWTCLSPVIPDINSDSIDAEHPMQMNVSLSTVNNEPYIPSGNQSLNFLLYPNPEFHYFLNSSIEFDDKNYVIIMGKNINKACQKTDISVKVGNHTCEVRSISSNQLICSLPKYLSSIDKDHEQAYDILANHDTIFVSIGNSTYTVKKQSVSSPEKPIDPEPLPFIYKAMVFLFIAILFITIIILCKRNKEIMAKMLTNLKKKEQQMTRLELRVASECKEAFAELQTLRTSFSANDSRRTLPFLNYHAYMKNVLFPNINDNSCILRGKAILIHKERGLQSFRELLTNRKFLLIFVRTLENEKSFSMNDRVYVASMLIIALQKDIEYCTDILKTLMSELIEKYMRGKSHPKLLLRKTESVVEKMLSAWFSVLLYDFLKELAAPPLFNLYNAIKENVNKGPVDMITSQARYCLSENKILRQTFDFTSLTIFVNIFQQTAKIIGIDSPIEKIPVVVLDCDTISQFKEKALDAIHYSINFSQRLNPSELNVEWFHDTATRKILSDDDSSSKIDGEWKQLNTLKHYGVPTGATLNLISDQETIDETPDTEPIFNVNKFQNKVKYKPVLSFPKIQRKFLTESTEAQTECNHVHYQEWHLVKPSNPQCDQDQNDSYQIIPEIFLARLLANKISLQKFVNELFNVIFMKTNQNSYFPIAIKFMFDFLDDQACQYNITDPEVVHVWKNNCLPLRFWVNLIKNPNFLFDVHKSNIVDSCLSVIAQVFMDSCSTSEQQLSKDSATTKLLYAKEIPIYNKLVEKYYADIKNMPRISSQDMNTMLEEVSKKYATDFDTNMPVHELFKYATKYKEKLIDALMNDEFSMDNSLVLKLEEVMKIMSSVLNY